MMRLRIEISARQCFSRAKNLDQRFIYNRGTELQLHKNNLNDFYVSESNQFSDFNTNEKHAALEKIRKLLCSGIVIKWIT